MKEKLLKIIEFYGVNNQQRKLMEEIFELQEAIIKNEDVYDIAHEIADCLVVINQFKEYFEITDEQIEDIMNYKIDRQLKRIEEENNKHTSI